MPLLRWRRRRQAGRRLLILTYHRANDPNLRAQFAYLRRHYRLLPLDAALAELYSPASPDAASAAADASGMGGKPDRRTPLAITFDDGYQDTCTHLLPLARSLAVPVTLFLIPGYLASGAPFWWLEGARLARHAPATTLAPVRARLDALPDPLPDPLDALEARLHALDDWPAASPLEAPATPVGMVAQPLTVAAEQAVEQAAVEQAAVEQAEQAARLALAQALDARLRAAPSVAAREALLAHAQRWLQAPAGPVDAAEAAAWPLRWEQARALVASGWVQIGAHTQHHPVLGRLRDPAEVAAEVRLSRETLQRELGQPITTLAYPIGAPPAIGPHAPDAARLAGFSWAVTTTEEAVTPQSDPYLVPRLPGVVTTHWLVMASELAGLLGFGARLRRRWRAACLARDSRSSGQPLPSAPAPTRAIR